MASGTSKKTARSLGSGATTKTGASTDVDVDAQCLTQEVIGKILGVAGPGGVAGARVVTVSAVARHDGPGGIHDGLKPRSAQPVHGIAGHRNGEARQKCRHPGHVPVIFSGLVGIAGDHIFNIVKIQFGVLLQHAPDHMGKQVIWPAMGE